MTAAAPIARFALAYGAGVAAGLLGVPGWAALPLAVLGALVPIHASGRPGTRGGALLIVLSAGLLSGHVERGVSAGGSRNACDVEPATITGRFLAPPMAGSAPFARVGNCGLITVVLRPDLLQAVGPGDRAIIEPGVLIRVHGRVRQGMRQPWFMADSVSSPHAAGDNPGPLQRLRWGSVRWRGRVIHRIHELFGERAPLVSALTLARSEGLSRELRASFTEAGIAHLLAISGFHVGVVAGLASMLLAALPISRRRRGVAAALVTGGYVALIGFPVAACRAALILGLVSMSVALGRVPSRWGGLGAAALGLLAFDPGQVASAGFQLSFAGAAGLIAWSRALESYLERTYERVFAARPPRAIVSGLGAGIAATSATLPFVAWHFERIAVLGIPATLIAAPLVTIALPGILLAMVLSCVSAGLAGFVAGGVSLVLDGLAAVAAVTAQVAHANVWVARPTIIAACLGVMLAAVIARHPGIGGSGRRRLTMGWMAVGIVAWPLLIGLGSRGSLEVLMIDVGQGDAIALRTPRGRWILVDAGPPSEGPPASQPVVRALRAEGVREIELMVLTHADADHFGGMVGVLKSFDVALVLDPALAVGKPGYRDVLAEARVQRVPWEGARAGRTLLLDDVNITILQPTDSAVAQSRAEGPSADANEVSIVLGLSWRDVRMVFTGDAYVDAEAAVGPGIGDVDILKVGHHGSETSTSELFLETTRPEHALLSVGRRNRYGHPTAAVMERLERSGATIYRTDHDGTVRLRIDRGGRIRAERQR